MTGVRMVSVFLRLVALWLVLCAFQAVGAMFAIQDIIRDGEPASHWWAVFPAAIFLSIAAIIWVFALPIAKMLYPAEKAAETVRFSAETVVRVGSCLLGLWTFCTAVPATARLIVLAYLRSHIDESALPDDIQLHAVYVLVQLVVAITLVFGNRAIYRRVFGSESL